MLSNLIIKNLALIENLDIELDKQLNIVTSEIGAGKSIMIGAVQLLFGRRADKSMIRLVIDIHGPYDNQSLLKTAKQLEVLDDFAGVHPKVAANANRHLLVAKSTKKNRTMAHIKPLDADERVAEIARMLGSEDGNGVATKHASELIANACNV